MTRIPALLLGVIAVLWGPVAEAWPWLPARGVYALPPGGLPVPQAVLDHPHVAGVTVRGRWQNVELAPLSYDWSYFDEQIARVAASGKPVFLKVTAGGVNVPPHVMDHVQTTFSFVDTDPYSQIEGTATIPVFWDPVFLVYKLNLIYAMGQRYAFNPAVRLVGVSCANAKTDDWAVPREPADITRWRAVGYTSAKLIDACKQTITAMMQAFPMQRVVLPVNANGKLDANPNHVWRTVADWALQTYPGRFMLAKHNLSARTPIPANTAAGTEWRLIYERRPNVLGQMLWFVTGDATCRMNGNVSPCAPVATLRKAVRTGDAYEMSILEIYHADILNPTLQPVIEEAARLLQ